MRGSRLTGNRSADDQGSAVLSHPTYQAAQLENGNGDEEGGLQREILVGFAPCRLKGADGEKEGRAVPAYLVQTVKFVCDAGYCGCNDGHVESDEKDGEDQSDNDEGELQGAGVIGCWDL